MPIARGATDFRDLFLATIPNREITLDHRSGGHQSQIIEIENCHIGKLTFSMNGPGYETIISIRNSRVCQFSVPKNFEVRDIILSNAVFSKRPENRHDEILLENKAEIPKLDRVSFAALHDWAIKSGNSSVAHIARGYELSIEKTEAGGLEYLVLWLWGAFGNYGMSPARPILYLVLSVFILFGFLLGTGTEVGISPESYTGWRSALLPAEGTNDDVLRALIGALESSLSPFSALSSRRLIVPSEPWIVALQVLQGYFALSMVLLAGFSLRRRFKFG